MEFYFIIGIIAWLISPIPLLILLNRTKKIKEKQQMLLQYLLNQGRIRPEELQQAGLLKYSAQQDSPNSTVMPSHSLQADAAHQIPVSANVPLIPPSEVSGTVPAKPIDATAAADTLTAPAVPNAKNAETALSDPAFIADAPSISEPSADIQKPQIAATEIESSDTTPVLPAADATPQVNLPARSDAALPNINPQKQTATTMPLIPNHISAITLMLSVGVLLVIIAGLIFVRTTWGKLTDGGRLATLAAGSVLFFGTSALARRVWNLTRTSMAFFTLGSAFLPISIWAAGYLNLLGEKLSGVGNPWLIALACGSFTAISLIAALIYRQKSWGIAFLSGLTVTYVSLAEALTLHQNLTVAPFLIAVTLYALILAFSARLIAPRICPQIGSVLEPVTIVLSILAAIITWCYIFGSCVLYFEMDQAYRWNCAIPAFIAAFVFFSPVFTERMKNLTAIPITLLTVPAFTYLLLPLCRTIFMIRTEHTVIHAENGYVALILMLCAAIWLMLLLTNCLPDETHSGFLHSAVVLTALSIPIHVLNFKHYPPTVSIILACATVVLIAIWAYVMQKKDSLPLRILIGVQIWSFCMIAVDAIGWRAAQSTNFTNGEYLIQAGCFLLGFAALVLLKKYRTGVSDLLLTVSPVVPLITLVNLETSTARAPMQYAAMAMLIVMILLYWLLAFAHDTRTPQQYIFAVLSPLLLFITMINAANGLWEQVSDITLTISWSLFSYLLGAAAYVTTKRRFHGVRKVLFALTMVPPMIVAVFYESSRQNGWDSLLLSFIGVAAAFGLWRLFSNHGFRPLAIASFSIALYLLSKATAFSVCKLADNFSVDFTVLMIASVWILLFSLLALAISKQMVFFVGSNIIATVMQFAAPITALLLSVILINRNMDEWDSFYFIYTFGLCILAWFTTQKSQIILPAICALSLILTIDSLRTNTFSVSNGSVFLLLLMYAGMTALFPYLGIVSREVDEKTLMQRRSWVLTILGGFVPVWLAMATSDGTCAGRYALAQKQWMYFFVPILIAGYLLHYYFVIKNKEQRRLVMLFAAAFGVIAFWMQPLVDVTDTWFEGKLHILPLLLFGIVIRQLYGEKAGGNFLFAVGVYTMLRLAMTAFATEAGADLMTLLITALIMFIASFYIKQKKWFLLGGLSLLLTAMFMHMKLTEGRQWWVYLLLAGMVLIVVAGSNEMLKQRGDSLKSQAGRLWEDWTW